MQIFAKTCYKIHKILQAQPDYTEGIFNKEHKYSWVYILLFSRRAKIMCVGIYTMLILGYKFVFINKNYTHPN